MKIKTMYAYQGLRYVIEKTDGTMWAIKACDTFRKLTDADLIRLPGFESAAARRGLKKHELTPTLASAITRFYGLEKATC